MSSTRWVVHAVADDEGLTLDELCRACAVSPDWVDERVRAGLLAPRERAGALRFDATLLLRVRVMRRVERDFDAVPELAALVADLLDEIRRLRARLRPGS
ncbi:MAG: MerR family transcriptional regulator [Rubrivivax sp.]|nr:MerR family transcriptional regulator [Rubrivivax sp.]